MFFFIAGVQPKKRILDDAPRACPACGRIALRRQRVDQMLSVFFIPLFPVKRGEPFFACLDCRAVAAAIGGDPQGPAWRSPGSCPSCGRRLERDFVFCPSCGNRL